MISEFGSLIDRLHQIRIPNRKSHIAGHCSDPGPRALRCIWLITASNIIRHCCTVSPNQPQFSFAKSSISWTYLAFAIIQHQALSFRLIHQQLNFRWDFSTFAQMQWRRAIHTATKQIQLSGLSSGIFDFSNKEKEKEWRHRNSKFCKPKMVFLLRQFIILMMKCVQVDKSCIVCQWRYVCVWAAPAENRKKQIYRTEEITISLFIASQVLLGKETRMQKKKHTKWYIKLKYTIWIMAGHMFFIHTEYFLSKKQYIYISYPPPL